MRTMACEQVHDAAPELALGILSGDERAAALAHLEGCAPCQQVVSSLAGVTDQLLLVLAPAVEPPGGFEERVLAPLTRPLASRRRSRSRALAAAAAVVVAACVAVAVLVLAGTPRADSAVVTGDMRTSTGDVVGRVYVHQQPPVLSLTLPGWTDRIGTYGAASYSVRVQRAGGPDQLLPVTMNSQSSWATALDIDPRSITSVAIVDDTGRVWCQTQLWSS
jgi:Putative zinc-finger